MDIKLFISLLFFSVTVLSQNTPYLSTFGYCSKDIVIEEITKKIKKCKKENLEASYNESKNGDTLIFYCKNTDEQITVKYTFDLPPLDGYKKKEYCGFQEYTFDCSSCAKRHMKEILNTCKFKKVSENKYLSEYTWRTELEIIRNSENKESIKYLFKFVNKPKEEYKALYNSLPKLDKNAL